MPLTLYTASQKHRATDQVEKWPECRVDDRKPDGCWILTVRLFCGPGASAA